MVSRLSLFFENQKDFFFNFEHVHLKSRHFFIYLFYCYDSGEDLDSADNIFCLLGCFWTTSVEQALYKIVCLEAMQPFDPGECSV